ERRRDGAFAETPTPRLSWTVETEGENWRQDSAEIRLDGSDVARVTGSESVFVDWPFPPLAPRARHTLEVRVTGADGEVSPWSDPVPLRSVFLGEGEWRAARVCGAGPAGVACTGAVPA